MFEIIKSTIEFIVKNVDKYISKKDDLPLLKNIIQILINYVCQEIISNNISRLDLNPKNIYELIGYLNKLLTLAQKIQALQGPSNLNKSEMEGLVNQLKSVMNQVSQRFLIPSLGGTNSATLTAASETTTTTTTTSTQTNVQIGVETTSISDNTIYYTIQSITVYESIMTTTTNPTTTPTITYTTNPPYSTKTPSTYPFPSGYNTLDLWYTFFNTDDTNDNVSGTGTMGDSNSTSPITVSINDKFSQQIDLESPSVLTPGQSYTFYFPYWNFTNADNTFVYCVSSLNTITYTAP